MKLLLLLGMIFHVALCQIEPYLEAFEELYNYTYQSYGETYMEGIKFTRQSYNYEAIDGEVFDFIIVGAGPAGCVLTSRLSEHRTFKVLLLEAGDAAPVINDIPYLIPMWNLYKPQNWGYLLEKDPNFAWGLINGTMAFPRGKGLGGTTLNNYMLHVKGCEGDYEAIARLGNDQWSWKHVKPIYEGLENTHIKRQDFTERGHWGSVFIGEISQPTISGTSFIEACQKNGMPYVDYNGRSQLGTSYAQTTRLNGLRMSAEKAYLRPIKKRPNVKILTRSLVEKVLINSKNVATGVTYTRDGKKLTAVATKEIILSAGTFNSPKLLMLSGIGPKKELKKHKIKVIVDLPVGETMKDHLAFFGNVFEVNKPITVQPPTTFDLKELVERGTGILTHSYVESLTFFQTQSSNKVELAGRPDMEFIMFPGDFSVDNGTIIRESFSVSQELYDNFFKYHEGKHVFIAIPMHLHPKATGRVTLKSDNVIDPPILEYPFLNNPEDVTAFIEAINRSIAICNEQPLVQYGCRPVSTVFPLCKHHVFHSNKYWECALRTISLTLHHQVGTCRMGPKCDPKAVVDQEGRVYGIKNLRVADPSIFPISLSAHTMNPSYMIGEKIAMDLKKQYTVFTIP